MKKPGIVTRMKAQLLGAGCTLVLAATAASAAPVAIISGNSAGISTSQPLVGRPYFPNRGVAPSTSVEIYPSYGAPVYGGPIYGRPAPGSRGGYGYSGGNNVVIVGDNTKVYVDNRGANYANPYGYPTTNFPGYTYPGYGGYPGYASPPTYVPAYPPVATYPGYGYNGNYGYSESYGDAAYNSGYGAGYGTGVYGGTTTSVFGQFSIGGGDTRLTIGAGQQSSVYSR